MITTEKVAALLRDILNEHPDFKDYGKKEMAAWALGMIGPAAEAAVPDLLRHLQSTESADARAEYLAALGRIVFSIVFIEENQSAYRVEVVRAAAPFLQDDNERVRWEAAVVIRFSDSDAIHVLSAIIAALDTATPNVAEYLAAAVGNIGPDAARAIPALKQAATAGRLDQGILIQVLSEVAVPYDDDLEDEGEDGEGEEWKEPRDPDQESSED